MKNLKDYSPEYADHFAGGQRPDSAFSGVSAKKFWIANYNVFVLSIWF